MYQSINEFIEDYKNESMATLKIFKALTDGSLNQKVYSEGRTLGFIAWHITLSVAEMSNRTGLEIQCPDLESDAPNNSSEIVSLYERITTTLIEQIKSKWNDSMLNDMIDMYGQQWSRAMVLNVIIKHEIHHRAQMTVLMRQAGLMVPGVYGPSKEEWVNYGAPAQK